MFKNLSPKEKTVAGIVVVIAVGAVIVLLFMLANGGNLNPPDDLKPSVSDVTPGDVTPADNTPEPDDTPPIGDSGMDSTDVPALFTALPNKEALDELFSLFCGYWTSGDLFVGFFFYENGAAGIEYGLHQSGFGAKGEVIDVLLMDPHEAEFIIRIPATPATEMDEAKPERTESVSIDISNYNDGRLNIQIDNLGGGSWNTYEFGGSTLKDAYN